MLKVSRSPSIDYIKDFDINVKQISLKLQQRGKNIKKTLINPMITGIEFYITISYI